MIAYFLFVGDNYWSPILKYFVSISIVFAYCFIYLGLWRGFWCSNNISSWNDINCNQSGGELKSADLVDHQMDTTKYEEKMVLQQQKWYGRYVLCLQYILIYINIHQYISIYINIYQ